MNNPTQQSAGSTQEADSGLVVGRGTRQDHLQEAGAFQEELPGAQLSQNLVAVDGRDGALSGATVTRAFATSRWGRRSSSE